jgi:hypothetical protein
MFFDGSLYLYKAYNNGYFRERLSKSGVMEAMVSIQ